MNGANTIERHERFDIMKVNCHYIIRYLRDIYGGKVRFRCNRLIIEADGEEFQVSLMDRTPMGKFVFHHTRTGNCFEDNNLARGIFLAWNYKMNTENNIPLSEEDWFYFMRDAYKYAEVYYVNPKSL